MRFRKKGIFGAFILTATLAGCGGSSSSEGSLADEDAVDSSPVTGIEGQDSTQDDTVVGSPIEEGDDDVGTIPEINEPDDDAPVIDGDEESSGEVVNSDTQRFLRWRAAFSDSPGSDLSSSETLLETVFELTRYDFVIELLDELSEIEQRIVNGDADFSVLNVAIAGYEKVYLCEGGGRVLVAANSNEQAGNFFFEQCSVGDTLIDGLSSITIITDVRDTRTDQNTTVNAQFSFTRDSVIRGISAILLQNETNHADGGKDQNSSLSGFYEEGIVDADGTTSDTFGLQYNSHTHGFFDDLDNRDAEDIGFAVRPIIYIIPSDDGSRWTFADYSASLRGDANDGEVDIGQATLDDDIQDNAQFVLQADNGDPDSFEWYGFSSATDVNSRVFNWSNTLSFTFPKILRPL